MGARGVGAAVEALAPVRLGAGFRRLLAAAWTSNLADGVAAAAGPLLVSRLTGSAALVALTATLRWAPPLLFGLAAGVLSDRLDRRRIVVVANLVRVAAVAGLVVAVLAGAVTAVLVLAVLGVVGTCEVFADNAFRTLTPVLVDRDDLPIANARLMTGFITLDQLAGVPIGALLFAAGYAWPFAAEAVLLLAAVAVLRGLRLPPRAPSAPSALSSEDVERHGRTSWRAVRRDVAEGFAWPRRHAAVRTLAVTILVFNVAFGAAWSVLVLWAGERLGLGPFGFGLLTTVSAVGGLVGTASYGRLTRRFTLGGLLRAGLVLETLTYLAFAVVRSPAVAMAVMVVFGAHAFVWGTTSTAVRQRAVPARLQGRVDAVYTLAVYGGLVVGTAVGGLVADRAGVTGPFWFAAAAGAVLLVFLWPRLVRVAHDEPDGGPGSGPGGGPRDATA